MELAHINEIPHVIYNDCKYYSVNVLRSIGLKVTPFASLVSYNIPIYSEFPDPNGLKKMEDLLIHESLLEVSLIKDTEASNVTKDIKTYLMIDERNGYVKIGSSFNPEIRERTLQSEQPMIRLIYTLDNNIEKSLHSRFKNKRIRGEWFNLSKDDIDSLVMELGFTPKQLR